MIEPNDVFSEFALMQAGGCTRKRAIRKSKDARYNQLSKIALDVGTGRSTTATGWQMVKSLQLTESTKSPTEQDRAFLFNCEKVVGVLENLWKQQAGAVLEKELKTHGLDLVNTHYLMKCKGWTPTTLHTSNQKIVKLAGSPTLMKSLTKDDIIRQAQEKKKRRKEYRQMADAGIISREEERTAISFDEAMLEADRENLRRQEEINQRLFPSGYKDIEITERSLMLDEMAESVRQGCTTCGLTTEPGIFTCRCKV